MRTNKETKRSYNEKLCYSFVDRPKGKLLWLHAASIGEFNSIVELVKILAKEMNLLITTTTITSSSLIQKQKFPKSVIHQILPIDAPVLVEKFFKHFTPYLAIFVESELWPNYIKKAPCAMILLNARMSCNSFRRWSILPSFAKDLLKKFDIILPGTIDDKHKFHFFSAHNIHYIGNLKYTVPALKCDQKNYHYLQKKIAKRIVWLGASTHEGEEEIMIKTHIALKKDFPDILTIIIPRHPTRGKKVSKLVEKYNLNVSNRSLNEDIIIKTDIYVADTVGELGLFYKLIDVVFIGGSMIPHGGQNILEAAHFNCAIIVGKYTENFKEAVKKFKKNNAIIEINNRSELENKVKELLSFSSRRNNLQQASYVIGQKQLSILEEYVTLIKKYYNQNHVKNLANK